jgi:hypothetical protein
MSSLTKMTIHTHKDEGRESDHSIYDGEAIMSQEQQDRYKALIGDGLSKVTVASELAEKDYGSGGSVVVSVTLTCDQSEPIIGAAIGLAVRSVTTTPGTTNSSSNNN